jgi:hypothetical protein
MEIRKYNIPAHMDIEKLFVIRKDGQITFTIRVNAGNIVDLQTVEYVDTRKKYPSSEQPVAEKFTISHSVRKGSSGNAVRDDNGDSNLSWWSSERTSSEYSQKQAAAV